jgi:transcription elongation GreA/GreB family factor
MTYRYFITVMTLKEKIHEQCSLVISGRLQELQQKLQGLRDSMANETKSTAGDKYETGRAMLHIEQDQVGRQVAQLTAQQAVLNSIDPTAKTQRVVAGSLVLMAGSYYYLSTGLGKMLVDGHAVVALSLQSPLGAKLKGLGAGDAVEMNGKEMKIMEIV